MTDVQSGVSRGQFLRNTAKGSIVLVGTGGVLASVDGVALAAGPTKSDISALQAAYLAESLAVYTYTAIIKNFSSFTKPKLTNIDYFERALADEKEHKKILGSALGSSTPTGYGFQIPASSLKTGQALLETGVALETAFVEAYLGAVGTLSSLDLKQLAAKFAANEATHFSFFDAAAGGHAVLPAVPGTATIPATVKKLTPFLIPPAS